MVDGVRGIRVLDGEEANKYLEIINIFHNVAQKYDCAFIKIPTIEKDELFTRTVGENTDIVTKQMFSFPDKKGRNLVLRPEGTAGVVRHHLDKKYDEVKKAALTKATKGLGSSEKLSNQLTGEKTDF